MTPEFDTLESRNTPAPAHVGARLNLDTGVVAIRGTEHADKVSVTYSPDLVTVRAGRYFWNFDAADVVSVRFWGNGGNDRIDYAFDFGDDAALDDAAFPMDPGVWDIIASTTFDPDA